MLVHILFILHVLSSYILEGKWLTETILFKDNEPFKETCHEKRLIRTLLSEYESRGRLGRPIDQENNTLDVFFGLTLIQILDLDERNQVLATNVWASYAWHDRYLSWDPELFGNISKVRVPASAVWIPDIKLYNYADERLEERRDASVVLQHDGGVQWLPQAIYKSSCSVNIQYFPFDMQVCKMKFGSWTYDGSKINLSLLHADIAAGFDLTEYIENNEWTIVSSAAKRNVIKYACCPGEPFIDITFELQMRRQPAFYNYILILPCILLSSLTLVLFWLPPETPAKMQLGMNIFVAFFVLLLLLAESTPPASSSIPLIGAYYCLNMILITLSAFLSVFVVNLYFHGARSEVPWIVKKIVIDLMARVFCMRSHVREFSDIRSRDKTYTDLPLLSDIHFNNSTEMTHTNEVAPVEDRPFPNSKAFTTGSTDLTEESRWLAVVKRDIREIRDHCSYMMGKQVKTERSDKITKNWRLVAIVLDRFFFFIYLIIMVVSVTTVFDFVIFGKDGNSSSD
ncbi:hypothetical protein DPMN_025563 [Dreissena polymorpha]|uniref:Uncharacterized protein n=1 Tax=Dreissena polymorpha TaxID=45954 RepID=A0A9D4LRK3_DREPO|nr:hypothetical protein DPMN_025563 [Dreissena polymorpha]